MNHSVIVKKCSELILNELEKHFHDIKEKKYMKGESEWTFKERIELGLSLELFFAGYQEII